MLREEDGSLWDGTERLNAQEYHERSGGAKQQNLDADEVFGVVGSVARTAVNVTFISKYLFKNPRFYPILGAIVLGGIGLLMGPITLAAGLVGGFFLGKFLGKKICKE